MKIMRIITVCIIVLFVCLSGKSLIPRREEIEDMEILKFIGLDYNENEEREKKASLSFVIEKEEANEDSSNGPSKTSQQIMNSKASSFSEASRKMQFYTDKNITGSHIKYFLVGEDGVKNDIDKLIDEISKDREIRLSSNIFLIKDSSAEDFLKEVVAADYKLCDILDSIKDKNEEKTIVKYLSISELLSGKLSDSGVYLIPTLKVDGKNDYITNIKEEEGKISDLDKHVQIYGYGIMKDNKFIDYLDNREAIIYNMIVNKSEGGNIDIECEDDNIISFDIRDIVTSYDFKFDEKEKIKEIQLKVEFRSNFAEVETYEDITISENIEKYQKYQEEKVKKQVDDLITKSKRLNVDIFNIGEKLNLMHPYKFRKIKSIWDTEYGNLNIKASVNVSIDRTYDIIKINK